ncbi:nucleotide pyrophosphohydrolase [Bifidobacterium sp. 64T4]|uniref:MazG nucleotide pyrophosphohydrolase domain-containing protein n=1 Tax=Bifidobacterium pongonis TaxID=2834432 RepID=UPI001C560B09|nr:MazG nucleotide pyrophosphohydrolase domain-containing protein [Bifidobacterium pongonis]MBW3094089.1 nucleotide pyrophosphohydrolase [Bifidobacterium pongonis]
MTEAAHDDYALPEGFEHCPKLAPVVQATSALDRVKAIVRILNEPGGCPWDGEQTNETLLKPLLEETYEYIDAVETGDRDNMREELGDTLLQSVFQAQVCSHDPADPFDIDEVCDRLVDKLITRHPHVFTSGDDDAAPDKPASAEDTLALWEKMKQKEKRRSSVLEGISHAQGALPRAAKVVSRVSKSPDRERLERAFEPGTATDATHDHRYADEIIDVIRRARRDGVDIETDLRCRLRDIETAITTMEKEKEQAHD